MQLNNSSQSDMNPPKNIDGEDKQLPLARWDELPELPANSVNSVITYNRHAWRSLLTVEWDQIIWLLWNPHIQAELNYGRTPWTTHYYLISSKMYEKWQDGISLCADFAGKALSIFVRNYFVCSHYSKLGHNKARHQSLMLLHIHQWYSLPHSVLPWTWVAP